MLVKITPEMAQHWVDTYTLAKELGIMRPIRPWWAQYLSDQMTKGLFSPVSLIVLGTVGDKTGIVNGNHTLRAIVKSGITLELPVEQFVYPSVDKMRHAYATADHNLTRGRYDSFRAYDVKFLTGINKSDARALSSAVLFMMNDFGRIRTSSRRVSDTDLLTAMRPWVPTFGKLIALVGSSHGDPWYKRIIRRSSVCAVAMVTMNYQPDMARRFWEAVVDGTNLKSKQAPALRLREYLIETIPASGRATTTGQMEQQDLMARKVAHCWNQYYLGRPMKLLRVSMEKPVEVLGHDSTMATGQMSSLL